MADTNYKLRAWMGANRISVEKLAELIGMPFATCQSKVSGKTEWKLSEIAALIEATGLQFEELF